ncbi:TPR domain protein [Metarhizium guizhouense ARSEF 977]|uniref:TPR domain protein n=1 Tax=Metarhizium guizhouense (strain ARSEF 977) TaxID=1276136 RepID=A0A0B4I176_METGA|nr:TPR domain protein [Metarhizium guizhouense ARSEF 977]
MNFIASFFPAAPDARVLAATVQSKALADMLANDASKVAQVYPWVADLRASKIPDSEIVKAMIETENVTWMEGALKLEAENYGWRETPERKETPRHLDHLEHGCVHPPRLIESSQRIPSDLHEPESSSLEKTVDVFAVFSQREQVALKHCGIGGVLHPGVLIGNNHGLVSFQGDGASVVYGDEINDTDRTHHWGPLESLSTIPFRTVRPWLGGPAEWIQYARGSASWSLSPLDFQWKSTIFGFVQGPSRQEKWHQGLLKYNVCILKELLLAMKELNSLGGCCQSFPIFTKLGSSSRLTAVDVAFDDVWEFVRQLSMPLTRADARPVLQDEGWRHSICERTLNTFRNLFGSEDEAVFFFYQSTRINGIASYVMHMAALFAQVFSVGLVTFCRGHCSDFDPPLVSRTIEKFHLLGAVPTGPCVTVERTELSCLGDMLRRPVWVFCLEGPLLRTGSYQFTTAIMSPKRHDIQARLSQILDTWHASIAFCGNEKSKSVQISIGGGFLSLVKADDSMLHWSAIDDGGTLPVSYLKDERQVIVGAVSVNADCPLYSEHCQRPLETILVDLRTHPGGWRPVSRSRGFTLGLSGGPMAPAAVSATASVTQQRFDPTFLKGSQVQQWNRSPHDLTMLNAPWGLELSLCTGVVRRVPLRALLNQAVVGYLQSKLNARARNIEGGGQATAETLDWNVIEQIQQAPSNSSAAAIWTGLRANDPAQFNAIAVALKNFVDAIQCSCVDKKNLLLWWPELNGSTDRGIKFEQSWCRGDSWIPILEDTETCAIFGLATCTCLTCVVSTDDSDTARACQNRDLSAGAPRPLRERQLILSTGIVAVGGARAMTNLRRDERLILNSYKAERHVFQVRGVTEGTPSVLEYRGRWSRPAIALYNLFNQNIQMTNVRESADYLTTGLEVLVVHRQP